MVEVVCVVRGTNCAKIDRRDGRGCRVECHLATRPKLAD
jgi:hypothetical protein